jgi:hypothetical protein
MCSSCAQSAVVCGLKPAQILSVKRKGCHSWNQRCFICPTEPPPPPPLARPYSMRVISACTAGSRNCSLYTNLFTLHSPSSKIRRFLPPPSLANMGRNIYLHRSQLRLSSIFTVHNIVKPKVHELSYRRVFPVFFCLFREYLFGDVIDTKCLIDVRWYG